MPKYTTNNLEQIEPELRFTGNRPTISDEQAKAWWDALSNGVHNDKTLNVRLNQGHNLYYFTDEGDLVRAVNERDNLSDPEFLRGLMAKSMDGRLFTRSAYGKVPRQVITNPNEDFEVGVADKQGNIDRWYVPNVDFLEEPKAPFFLKILAYPFVKSVREQFQTYWQDKETYAYQEERRKWIYGFVTKPDKGNVISEDLEESKKIAIEEDEKARQERERQRIEDWKKQEALKEQARKRERDENNLIEYNEQKEKWGKDVSAMTEEEFSQYRKDLSSYYDNIGGFRYVIERETSTIEDVYDCITRQIERHLYVRQNFDIESGRSDSSPVMKALKWGEIKGTEEKMSAEFFAIQKEPWHKMKATLRDAAHKYVSEETVKGFLKGHKWNNEYWNGKMFTEIRNACKQVIPEAKKLGVVFDLEDFTPEVVGKMMLVRYQREGQKGMQQLADNIKAQEARKSGQQVEQPVTQVKQPVTQVNKDAPAKGGMSQ